MLFRKMVEWKWPNLDNRGRLWQVQTFIRAENQSMKKLWIMTIMRSRGVKRKSAQRSLLFSKWVQLPETQPKWDIFRDQPELFLQKRQILDLRESRVRTTEIGNRRTLKIHWLQLVVWIFLVVVQVGKFTCEIMQRWLSGLKVLARWVSLAQKR